MHYRRGSEIEVVVRDLAYGGAGVADLEGLVVMVQGGLPGDRVRAQIRRKRSKYMEARAIEILQPSSLRRSVPCPHVGVCGGCPLMALDVSRQTEAKALQGLELLRRIGGFAPDDILPPIPPPRPLWYRNKMEFTFSRRPWSEKPPAASAISSRGPALGLHPPGRFDLVFDVTDCKLQSPLTNRILSCIRLETQRLSLPCYESRRDEGLLRHVILRTSRHWPDLLVALVTREWDRRIEELAATLRREVPQVTGCVLLINRQRATVARGDEERLLWGRPFIRESLGGWTWNISASSFFQTSTEGAEILLNKVLEWSQPETTETCVDLYCGVGTFTLPLGRRMRRVVGIESVGDAVRTASEMSERHGLGNVSIMEALVENVLRLPHEARGEGGQRALLDRLELESSPDLLLLDPPRAGLHPKALPGVMALSPGRILYVSCNPATQARDAGALVSEGYRPVRFQVLNLFPQTPHMESLLLLKRD